MERDAEVFNQHLHNADPRLKRKLVSHHSAGRALERASHGLPATCGALRLAHPCGSDTSTLYSHWCRPLCTCDTARCTPELVTGPRCRRFGTCLCPPPTSPRLCMLQGSPCCGTWWHGHCAGRRLRWLTMGTHGAARAQAAPPWCQHHCARRRWHPRPPQQAAQPCRGECAWCIGGRVDDDVCATLCALMPLPDPWIHVWDTLSIHCSWTHMDATPVHALGCRLLKWRRWSRRREQPLLRRRHQWMWRAQCV